MTRGLLWKVLPARQAPFLPLCFLSSMNLKKGGGEASEETGYMRKAVGHEKDSDPHTPACCLPSGKRVRPV